MEGITFNGQKTTTPISVIIPTYNRAPHPVEHDSNPLAWCLESILAQRNANLSEIVVIDDDSTDYTTEVFDYFAEQAKKRGVEAKLIRNKKNRGSSVSRNRGVSESESPLLMFVDDDCVFDNRMLFGATFTLETLPDEATAVHIPVYHRTRQPQIISAKEIGVFDLKNGIVKGNFGAFPEEYLSNPEMHLLNKTLKIFKPIQIQNLGGVFLAKRKPFEEVGGFPENLAWKNSYREETDLSLRLTDAGHTLHFSPDPKFSSIHFKYGATEQSEHSGLDAELNYKITQSNAAKTETGNRVDTKQWFHDVIMSTFVTLAKRSPTAAEEYAERMNKRFVEENNFAVSGVGTKIPEKAKRIIIYNQAMSEARHFVKGVKTA